MTKHIPRKEGDVHLIYRAIKLGIPYEEFMKPGIVKIENFYFTGRKRKRYIEPQYKAISPLNSPEESVWYKYTDTPLSGI